MSEATPREAQIGQQGKVLGADQALEQAPERCGHSTKPQGASGQHCQPGSAVGGVVRGKELDWVVLMGLFQLEIF